MVVVNLSGATFSLSTLGGAASFIVLGVGAWISLGCTMTVISYQQRSAAVCYVTIVLYGTTGAGFSRAWMRYCAAWVAASADDMRGIGNLRGKFHSATDFFYPVL